MSPRRYSNVRTSVPVIPKTVHKHRCLFTQRTIHSVDPSGGPSKSFSSFRELLCRRRRDCGRRSKGGPLEVHMGFITCGVRLFEVTGLLGEREFLEEKKRTGCVED